MWAAGMVVLAALLAGPLPAALDRASALRQRPRLSVLVWSGWAAASAAVLVLLVAGMGFLIGTWCGAAAAGAWIGAAASTAWLVGAGAKAGLGLRRARRRHVAGVEVVADFDDQLGAWVLPDDRPLAYTVPDRGRPVVVLTRGFLALTGAEERLAVLSHEHAHGRRTLSGVRAAWTVLASALPVLPRRGLVAVELATEMLADDAARRAVGPQPTIAALCRLQTGLPAACDEFGWTPDAVTLRRVRRLLAA